MTDIFPKTKSGNRKIKIRISSEFHRDSCTGLFEYEGVVTDYA